VFKNQSYAFSAGVVMIFVESEGILKKKISWRNDSGSIVQSIAVFWHREVRVTIGDLMQNSQAPVEKFLLVSTGFGPCPSLVVSHYLY